MEKLPKPDIIAIAHNLNRTEHIEEKRDVIIEDILKNVNRKKISETLIIRSKLYEKNLHSLLTFVEELVEELVIEEKFFNKAKNDKQKQKSGAFR